MGRFHTTGLYFVPLLCSGVRTTALCVKQSDAERGGLSECIEIEYACQLIFYIGRIFCGVQHMYYTYEERIWNHTQEFLKSGRKWETDQKTSPDRSDSRLIFSRFYSTTNVYVLIA